LSNLPFTGERFTPECVREMWYEHYHRYAFARALVAGKSVADIACGEGYGAALLAQSASSVVGIDLSAEAINHAQQRYAAQTNLRFQQGDATRLNLADASVDVISSFETLEHLAAQTELLAGFARVLKADGLLIISSPDKFSYSDQRQYQNEFHVRELYRAELLDLLRTQFPQVRLYGQKLLFQSALWRLDGALESVQTHTAQANGAQLKPGLDYPPLYFVVVCARQPSALPVLPDLDLFGDHDEAVYRHYEHEIRKNMQAGAVLNARDAELAALRIELAETQARLASTQVRLASLTALPAPASRSADPAEAATSQTTGPTNDVVPAVADSARAFPRV